MIPIILVAAIVCFPQKSNAQVVITNPYPQQMNWYLNTHMRRMAVERALRRKSARKAKHRGIKKKVVRRKAQRVSMLENMIEPRYRIDADLPKRSEIV